MVIYTWPNRMGRCAAFCGNKKAWLRKPRLTIFFQIRFLMVDSMSPEAFVTKL